MRRSTGDFSKALPAMRNPLCRKMSGDLIQTLWISPAFYLLRRVIVSESLLFRDRLISALLGAITRGDLLLQGVLGRGLLNHRIEQRQVGRVEIRDDLPRLTVPLLDAGLIRALMI